MHANNFNLLTSVWICTFKSNIQRKIPNGKIPWIIAALTHLRQTFFDSL